MMVLIMRAYIRASEKDEFAYELGTQMLFPQKGNNMSLLHRRSHRSEVEGGTVRKDVATLYSVVIAQCLIRGKIWIRKRS